MTETDRRAPRAAEPAPTQPRLGALGGLRWAWRQLTSMRTALYLLLGLAVAAVPGSIFPQRSLDAARVSRYLEDHQAIGPWLDRLGFFDVFTSVWFSAIYLLLMVSLIGCVGPRTRQHWAEVRAQPPRAPSRLDRLAAYQEHEVRGAPREAADAIRATLRSQRFRIRQDSPEGEISAERGYLRETGNLAFHVALLVVIAALGWGYLVGWRGDRIVAVGGSLTNTQSAFDTFSTGPLVDRSSLQPFTIRLDRLDVRFEELAEGSQLGAPRDFRAQTTVRDDLGAAPRQAQLSVNGPLDFGGASAYLLGNGYAPVITVRDATGAVLYSQPTPFLPQDGQYTSVGAVKVLAAQPRQLGFSGVFLPSAYLSADGPASAFPDLKRPALVLSAYEGTLFPQGRPQSVYSLDLEQLTQLKDSSGGPQRIWLEPGETVQLPGGRGSISMGEQVPRWAGISVRYDPAKPLALGSSLVALLGLVMSLLVRRRRVFVRVSPAPDGPDGQPRSLARVGAIAKGEDPMLAPVVARLGSRMVDRCQADHADGPGGARSV